MQDFMTEIRRQLRNYETILNDDVKEFDIKLNAIRDNLSNYIQRQIQYLANVEQQYQQEFNYLDEENKKTSKINRQQFDKLCLSINQYDDNSKIVTKLLENFQKTFPLRPIMLKSIPEYEYKDIQINDFIKKQEIDENRFEKNLTLPTTNYEAVSSTLNDDVLTENNEQDENFNTYRNSPSELLRSSNRSPSVQEHSFITTESSTIQNTQISSLVSGSIGFSYHKQLASQNNDYNLESQSRLSSTCSTKAGPDMMIGLLFKIPYQHNRNSYLLAYHERENYLLIYSPCNHKLEYLSFHSHQISNVNLPSADTLLNLGYSTHNDLFYLSSRKKKNLVLFRLNQQQIEIEREIPLVEKNDYLINAHMYKNFIVFLHQSSSRVSLGKYDIEKSSFLPQFNFQHELYDEQEQSSYEIMDFAINNIYISFLIRLINKNKFMIVIHDFISMDRLQSFDLIDAIKPLSIISTDRKLESTATSACNDEIEGLLFVNDVKSHLIHCCSHQQYLIPIQVNAFGICPLNNGNLALVAGKDIRGLNVQDYLQQNNVQFD
ncbi:unnamed protein product [Rotaria socialis]|uniref:Uncharacterized protein n=1 Tax=Rotaria socialis TaxID=392032 RepID=A0A817V9W9_9BILA|nr:unnamed protein product [Rotaria socialis]CAF3334735.1 unnamed protein product [Rotaria socialis]CAF3346408.1 unnamed protein product [Rotaria socialis]CAF3378546.1 unnamed protein product [Rotaria socialis]CAF4118088.1 unnamed protein product [Rotaria socialis]